MKNCSSGDDIYTPIAIHVAAEPGAIKISAVNPVFTIPPTAQGFNELQVNVTAKGGLVNAIGNVIGFT